MDKLHIAECFGAAAAQYNEHAHIQQQILNWSFDNLQLSIPATEPVAQVLDLGCGTGNALPVLTHIADNVIAVDIAQPMLDYAQKRNTQATNITYQCADFDALTDVFAANSIARVFSSMALQWSSSPQNVMSQISAILTAGGRADLTILIAPSFSRLREAWSCIGRGYAVNRFSSLEQWQNAANLAGLVCHSECDVFIDEYPDFLSMLHSIKDVGASSAVAEPELPLQATILTKHQLRDASAAFLELNDGVFSLDYHVVQLQLSR